uniref:MAR-binding filament-like protein 1 n=1 Tax=Nicotiana sylvestris TaxID=4096 RepID=A0A1U7WHJ3_NICSY|nr:PREDICTED: MAR-binding filament-like protein 1 [Nicotiana sylvestris]
MADKTSEDEKLELISKAKERLELFKLEASEKIQKVSSSEKKLKRVVKKLQTLQQERENLEGKSIVFNRKKEFILGLWEDICNRLSKTRPELLSSYREQIIEIFEDVKNTNILDFSPLEDLLNSLFELAASYDQERSNMADKTSEDEKLELISKAKERLKLFKLEASEKIQKVSSSEKKLKRVVKKLQTLQQERENLEGVIEATQKEVEEIQKKNSTAETEVSSYDNINLLIVDDSANLEEKKKNLETSCQELINYKFCLD